MAAVRATAESLPRKAFGITAPVAALALFLAVGALGAYRYLDNYWVYRGFSPTHDPAYVQQRGTSETIYVTSPALGGRRQKVVVYLPPGYNTQPNRRYPVLYLLHGFPGDPTAFLHELRMGVIDDVYLADKRAQPLILVMPFGSTGIFTDKEWANGYRPHEDWETFMARDVVRAIDSRYRTIANRSGRAIAGLSEGGYGALNIGFHHPNEFSVLESWSGYQTADPVRSVFGTSDPRLEWNSPFVQLPRLTRTLRRDRTYIWFYTGTTDGLRAENTAFARALAARHLSYQYFVANGGHEWALWRHFAPVAYRVAAEHLHG